MIYTCKHTHTPHWPKISVSVRQIVWIYHIPTWSGEYDPRQLNTQFAVLNNPRSNELSNKDSQNDNKSD